MTRDELANYVGTARKYPDGSGAAESIVALADQRDRLLGLVNEVNIGQSDEPCCGPEGWGERREKLAEEIGPVAQVKP